MKAARRSRQKTSDGTRTSVWDLKPHQMQSTAPTSVCSFSVLSRSATRARRQEMPFYRRCLDSWANPDWQSGLDKNDADTHYPPGLPALHPQVQCVEDRDSWSGELTCGPQTVTRRDIRTWLRMCLPHSVWRLVIRSLLVSRYWERHDVAEEDQVNVDHCPKPCVSTCSGWRRTRLRARRLASSELRWGLWILLYQIP